jgi:hypothetical protein
VASAAATVAGDLDVEAGRQEEGEVAKAHKLVQAVGATTALIGHSVKFASSTGTPPTSVGTGMKKIMFLIKSIQLQQPRLPTRRTQIGTPTQGPHTI